MAVLKRQGLPSGRGERDAQHHKDRVRRQITDHLKNHIGGEDIITGDGKIKVPVKGSKQFHFIFDRGKKGQGESDDNGAGNQPGTEDYEVWLDMAEVESMLFEELELPRLKPKKETDAEVADIRFDTIAVKGPQIDKRATMRRNLLRTQITGEDDMSNDDLRYMSYREKPRPKSKAVVFMAMDVSGSMGAHEKQLARLFFYWTVKFLRFRYDTVDVRFISHTADAQEVTENEFFNRVESGGTMVSSAYRLIEKMQRDMYPTADWNVYVLHASDGDNWEIDNKDVHKAIARLCKVCSLVGYLEIGHEKNEMLYAGWGSSYESRTLQKTLEKMGSPGPEFISARVNEARDIWGAIRLFFSKDQVDTAIKPGGK
jgi:uncharacterized sporulation protein YeaH/YhbH (DUF444 family)